LTAEQLSFKLRHEKTKESKAIRCRQSALAPNYEKGSDDKNSKSQKVNWLTYIAWAEAILEIAAKIIAASAVNGNQVNSRDALRSAHDLVEAHVKNLKTARSDNDSSLSTENP
jgi:hypothetical protein